MTIKKTMANPKPPPELASLNSRIQLFPSALAFPYSSTSVHNDDRRLVRLMLNCFPQDAPEMAFWMGEKVREAKQC